ncbi:hypothetical protein ebA1541 [Aromatoleum aromaticum EbN1]|uniref:Uncharacterized protein n=1 Tax=Aromatoleum aromaticum (strain DSM 19018 / LMG 30748 / EbN1) TaxID=76114 RepID=Q5P6U4_AROAE|nr:hypothetical protein ebA1541 [Aromatoleum aromaticum EbN1]
MVTGRRSGWEDGAGRAIVPLHQNRGNAVRLCKQCNMLNIQHMFFLPRVRTQITPENMKPIAFPVPASSGCLSDHATQRRKQRDTHFVLLPGFQQQQRLAPIVNFTTVVEVGEHAIEACRLWRLPLASSCSRVIGTCLASAHATP